MEYPCGERAKFRSSWKEFGRSVLGAPLEVMLPSDKCHCLIVAGTHGDEPETVVAVSAALRTIGIPKHVAVVLAANPDGLARGTRANSRYVDLNRNWPTKEVTEKSTYRWLTTGTDRVELNARIGNEPEVETLALQSLLRELKPKIVLAVHAPLACIDSPDRNDKLGILLSTEMDLPLEVLDTYPGSFGRYSAENGLRTITIEFPRISPEESIERYSPVFGRLMSAEAEIFG